MVDVTIFIFQMKTLRLRQVSVTEVMWMLVINSGCLISEPMFRDFFLN